MKSSSKVARKSEKQRRHLRVTQQPGDVCVTSKSSAKWLLWSRIASNQNVLPKKTEQLIARMITMRLKDSLMWTGAPAIVVRSERLQENVSVVSNSPNRKTSLWKVYYEFTVQPRLSGPRLSGFLDYPDFFSSPNFVMNIHQS